MKRKADKAPTGEPMMCQWGLRLKLPLKCGGIGESRACCFREPTLSSHADASCSRAAVVFLGIGRLFVRHSVVL